MSGSDSPTFFHGQPWSSWIERIGRDKPLSDEESEAKPTSTVTRLSAEDIDLYGFCPERDTFYGVVCEICNAIVKPQALIQHMESRHPSGTANFPPPSTPTTKAPVKTPYCKVSKLKKTQPTTAQLSSGNKVNHVSVKRTSSTEQQQQLQQQQQSHHHQQQQQQQQQQQAVAATAAIASLPNNSSSTPLTISSSPHSPLESGPSLQTTVQATNASGSGGSGASSSPVKSPGTSGGLPRRKRLKTDRSLLKDREYDPDRHCGVWNEETGKPCTRSLTCKAHTVSLRRTVIGRSKTFDKLLAEHRAAKELPSGARPAKLTVTGTVLTLPSPTANTNPPTPNASTSSLDPEAPTSPPVLSLPDTYPLPKAVDLLYRCLAPHGSTKPTKLEEEFGNEELRSLESSLVEASASSSSSSSLAATQSSTSTMAPISVVLPSLSPLSASAEEAAIATLIPTSSVSTILPTATTTPMATVATTSIGTPLGSSSSSVPHEAPSPTLTPPPPTNSTTPSPPQPPPPLPPPTPPPSSSSTLISSTTTTAAAASAVAGMTMAMTTTMTAATTTMTTTATSISGIPSSVSLEGDSSLDVDPDEDPLASIYAAAFKDEKAGAQHLSLRSNNLLLSPISKSSYHRQLQQVSSMPSLNFFEPVVEQPEQRNVSQINGKRFNHGTRTSPLAVTKQATKRSKQEHHRQDYSTAVQLEATTTSTPYPNFGDITWSNCHPEPLAVSRWLRITSSRKQYNFNIH
ncbi:hypothetical protein KPH14_009905 [Odynerus spinipes]|uniref:SCA7 domain-containing protein n=1 Tax=Odynerus spinipes TaxID=1348599 RepID=A0AAD9VSA6_9HYME|nr:hypothetical protein KPH14_009905 [Odynerus spinipes]